MFSKIGHFEFISERDLAIMYHVLEGIPFNMASTIVTYIVEATRKNRFGLPYGMVLTLLFRESGIDIPKGESVKNLRHTDYCNEASLYRYILTRKFRRFLKRRGPPNKRRSFF